MIEDALFSLLSAVFGNEKIYPLVAKQGIDAPYIVYQRISAERTRSLSGPSGRSTPRFQIDVYAEKYKDARNLANSVRLALDGYSGTVSDTAIGNITLESDEDMLDDTADPILFRVSMDFMITHSEEA